MDNLYRSQFRLPYSLYESLKEAADKNRRSVNAELVARLEASFDQSSSFLLPAARPSEEMDQQEFDDLVIKSLRDASHALARQMVKNMQIKKAQRGKTEPEE